MRWLSFVFAIKAMSAKSSCKPTQHICRKQNCWSTKAKTHPTVQPNPFMFAQEQIIIKSRLHSSQHKQMVMILCLWREIRFMYYYIFTTTKRGVSGLRLTSIATHEMICSGKGTRLLIRFSVEYKSVKGSSVDRQKRQIRFRRSSRSRSLSSAFVSAILTVHETI